MLPEGVSAFQKWRKKKPSDSNTRCRAGFAIDVESHAWLYRNKNMHLEEPFS
jgi:hypothetical protein